MPPQPLSQNGSTPGHGLLGGLTDEQIGRLAEMIADGRCEFPRDLQSPDVQRLDRQASSRLRDRLIHFIARAVADHVGRAADPGAETSEHA